MSYDRVDAVYIYIQKWPFLRHVQQKPGLSKSEECQSMPALVGAAGGPGVGAGLGIIPEHSLLDSCTRLSISLEESVFKVSLLSFFYLIGSGFTSRKSIFTK